MELHGEKLHGEELTSLRLKILAIADVHPDYGPAQLADLMLKGKNRPKMKKRALEKLVSRTFKNKAQDGRVRSGRKPWVRTKRFIEDVRKKAEGKKRRSLRILGNHKGCHHKTIWTVYTKDLELIPKRRVKVSKLTESHQEKRVKGAKTLLKRFGSRVKRKARINRRNKWDRIVFTDFSAPIRMHQDINRSNDYVWMKKGAKEIPRDVEHGVDILTLLHMF